MKYTISVFLVSALSWGASETELDKARNRQDRPALEKLAKSAAANAAQKPKDPMAQYQSAVAHSYLSEVALEVNDRGQARSAAEAGIPYGSLATPARLLNDP